MINKEEDEKGINLLKKIISFKNENNISFPIKVIIAGGDGTVLSMIQTFFKEGIDINHCIFGHMPLGTGNDLSNACGFSNSVDISENRIDLLYNILIKYIKAKCGKIDIWRIQLKLDPNKGKMLYNEKDKKVELKDKDGNIVREFDRTIINYFSFGYDARVGYNFDKKRTSSRFCNKCVYFCEGMKKNCCRQNLTVPKFLKSFTVYEDNYNKDQNITITSNKFEETNNKKVKIKFQFKSKLSLLPAKNSENTIIIKGDPVSIIGQNINYYMAGVKDIWKAGKDNLDLQVISQKEDDKDKYTNKLKAMSKQIQSMDDKALEFFTFSNGFTTGFEKVFGGFGKKLYHGGGPIVMKFFETKEYDVNDKYGRIYLNCDGEYYHVVCPLEMRIELDRSMCNGQLPFLINK